MTERLVFLHGFTQTHHHWHAVAQLIAAGLPSSPTLAFIDLPGHGLSADDHRSVEDVASELGRLGGAGTWIAYSMGGRFALAAAGRRPPEIEALVVIGANAGLDAPDDRSARIAEDERRARRIEAVGVDAFVDEWLSMPMFAGVSVDAADRGHRCRNTIAGLASSLRLAGSGAQQPLWGALATIEIPVLVMAGARDEKFTAIGLRLAGLLPHGEFHAIPGAGHAAPAERPAATATVITRWLHRAGGRAEGQPSASPTVSSAP